MLIDSLNFWRSVCLSIYDTPFPGKLEDAGTERAESKTHRQRHIARPLSTQRTLCSPTVCHLNQKVVLRYTKRALMPHTPPEVFQAEWPNYTQQAPGSLVT